VKIEYREKNCLPNTFLIKEETNFKINYGVTVIKYFLKERNFKKYLHA